MAAIGSLRIRAVSLAPSSSLLSSVLLFVISVPLHPSLPKWTHLRIGTAVFHQSSGPRAKGGPETGLPREPGERRGGRGVVTSCFHTGTNLGLAPHPPSTCQPYGRLQDEAAAWRLTEPSRAPNPTARKQVREAGGKGVRGGGDGVCPCVCVWPPSPPPIPHARIPTPPVGQG